MQSLILHAKLALYARQAYLCEMTRGLGVVLIVDAIVTLILKKIEHSQRRLAKELAVNTNSALRQVNKIIQ